MPNTSEITLRPAIELQLAINFRKITLFMADSARQNPSNICQSLSKSLLRPCLAAAPSIFLGATEPTPGTLGQPRLRLVFVGASLPPWLSVSATLHPCHQLLKLSYSCRPGWNLIPEIGNRT